MNTSTILTKARELDIGNRFEGPTMLVITATSHADKIAAEAAKISNDPRLSDSAKAADVKTLANKSAKAIGKLQTELAGLYKSVDDRRANLAPKYPGVSENMQLAVAAALRRMSTADVAKMLQSPDVDKRVLATVFELPEMLHNVPAGLTSAIKSKIVERDCAEQLAELAAEEKAIELAQAAIQVATDSAIELAGHEHSATAAKVWLEQNF